MAELTPDRDGFVITFTIEEGERYRFGKVDVNIKLKDLPRDLVLPLLTVQSDDWYNAEAVEHSISALTDALGNRGYAFVEVKPEINRNRDEHTIDIVFNVQEGPQVYVERIDITGNVRTLDKVIRREFRLVEGDAFNTSKLRRTRERLQNLGFFSNVDIKTLPGSAPDKTVIEVNVEEQSTGELTLGAGFSTADGPLGMAGIRERNLLGKGQDLQLNGTLAGSGSRVALSFTEPYFLDRPIAAGFDIFDTTYNNFSTNNDFSENNLGFGLRASYDMSEYLRHTVRYTLSRQDITNVSPTAALAIQQEAGVTVNSVIGNEFLYDRRDSRFDPSQGYYIRLRSDLSTVPGSTLESGAQIGVKFLSRFR